MAASARAWAGTTVFLILAPGVVAGLAPWLITRWRWPDWGAAAAPVIAFSTLLVGAGVGFLLHSFARFAAEGRGTPAPVAPTERLVVSGAYRYVCNPMYLAVLAIILGQALLFASGMLVLYAACVAAAFAIFVRLYEEPTLQRRYGAGYQRYRANVPRWVPRLRPRAGPA